MFSFCVLKSPAGTCEPGVLQYCLQSSNIWCSSPSETELTQMFMMYQFGEGKMAFWTHETPSRFGVIMGLESYLYSRVWFFSLNYFLISCSEYIFLSFKTLPACKYYLFTHKPSPPTQNSFLHSQIFYFLHKSFVFSYESLFFSLKHFYSLVKLVLTALTLGSLLSFLDFCATILSELHNQ